MEILIEKRSHMVLASGPIQVLRQPVDEPKRQPDGKEGHQGHLSGMMLMASMEMIFT